MYRSALAVGHKGFLIFEDWLNRIFSPKFNPMYYLGAIAFLFTWMVFISGLYLMFVYSISVEKAYDSLEGMNWFNQLMRSIHRYASDGAMIALLVHMVREYFNDRYRRWRWVAWVTGVALILTYWGLGVTGYWMVWDQRAQVIARLSAEFLDFIPIWGEPLTRAFISNETVTNILFIGVIFVHLAVPTIALFFLWQHVIRISRPVINPPRELTIAITILTVILCFAYPATSVGRADMNIFAARFGIDWWYLVLYPFLASYPVWGSWAFTIIGTAILTALPWFIRPEHPGKAEVILPKCVGCELCFKDCPYEAIMMTKRTDGVFVSGCQAKDCHFREGDKFLEGRLFNKRPPVMRKKQIDPSRVRAGWFAAIHNDKYFGELKGFISDIKEGKKEEKVSVYTYVRERLTVPGIILLAIPAVFTLIFSDFPYTFYEQKDSMLMFSFKHSGKNISEGKPLTKEELAKLPPHMRVRRPKSTKRYPVYAEVEIDGKKVVSASYNPGGLKGEGSSYAYEKLILTPGTHKVKIRMSDTNSHEHFDYIYEQDLEFKPGRQICLDFSEGTKSFYIRN